MPHDGARLMLQPLGVATPMPVRTALIADDCSITREMHAGLLHSLGYTVIAVSSGSAAASETRLAIETHGQVFDLTLLDFDMPGGDGPSAARAIRESLSGRVPGVMVCVTGHARDQVAALCSAAGFDGIVSKPLEIEALTALLGARRAD